MNPLTLEWIEKAEGDFATAGRELRARKEPELRGGLLPRTAMRREVPEGYPPGAINPVWQDSQPYFPPGPAPVARRCLGARSPAP